MNAKEITQALVNYNWSNRQFYDIAKKLNDVNDDYRQGRVTNPEYQQFIDGIDTASIEATDSGSLADKHELNTVIVQVHEMIKAAVVADSE